MEYALWLKMTESEPKTIVTTPYSRAQQTSYVISSYLGTLPCIFYEEDLGEINWDHKGHWTEISDENPDWVEDSKDPDWCPVITYEGQKVHLKTGRSVYKRAVPALIERCRQHEDRGTLLIVSHNYTLRALIAFLNGEGVAGMGNHDPRNLAKYFYDIDPSELKYYE